MDGSTNAPTDLSRPNQEQPPDSGPHFRMRGVYREGYDFNREGRCVLVGRSIANELAALRSFALILAGLGAAVLALGLGGGWWIASHAIRPVEAISAAASRISAGHLSERIDVADTDGELGQLAVTLNSTFARLDAAFAQQRQFTADASHELRTPLAVLISEAQTTLAHPRTAAEYRETVEACLETAQQMRRLTEALLELARFDAGQSQLQPGPVDLAATARTCVELIRPLAEAREIQIHCDFAPAKVTGDDARLSQVITNLLTNAIHYNKPQGEIHVRTLLENNEVKLTVADTGPGIAPEDLPHIFERFYRSDKARTSSSGRNGLGLAICKAVVDEHHGSIEAINEPGAGATFTVRLPAAPLL
jgi:heavy metal sensor kinase